MSLRESSEPSTDLELNSAENAMLLKLDIIQRDGKLSHNYGSSW